MGVLRGIGTAGAMIAGGAIGGLVGSYTGAPESPNTITGAAIGAAGGAVMANGGTAMLGKGVLGAASIGGGAMLGGAGLIGSAAMKAAPVVGMGALAGATNLINGASSTSMAGTLVSPIRRHVGAIGNFAEGLIRFDLPTDTLNPVKRKGISGAMEKVGGVKLTTPYSVAKSGWDKAGKLDMSNKFTKGNAKILAKKAAMGGKGLLRGTLLSGASVVAASTAITGAMGAYNEYKNMKMGVMDNYVTNATPRVPVYEQNGGATGDLVFAMNKLRN